MSGHSRSVIGVGIRSSGGRRPTGRRSSSACRSGRCTRTPGRGGRDSARPGLEGGGDGPHVGRVVPRRHPDDVAGPEDQFERPIGYDTDGDEGPTGLRPRCGPGRRGDGRPVRLPIPGGDLPSPEVEGGLGQPVPPAEVPGIQPGGGEAGQRVRQNCSRFGSRGRTRGTGRLLGESHRTPSRQRAPRRTETLGGPVGWPRGLAAAPSFGPLDLQGSIRDVSQEPLDE